MWIRNSTAVLLLFCILSCRSGIEKGFNAKMQKFGINITSDTRAVLQIGDGGCANCNQSMINEFCRFIDNKNMFFMVAADPNKLDISCFLRNKAPNIIFCEKKDLEKSRLEFDTKVFLLKNGVIDTTIYFDAKNWMDATSYVSNVLSEK
jgi:hypothetical protein